MSRVKVYVGNLAFELVARDIEDVFSRFGRVQHVSLKRGFAFLLFDDIRDAETAVKEMDNVMLHGRRIKVEFASGVPNSGYKNNADNDRRAPRTGDYSSSSSNVNASSSGDVSKSLFVGNIPPHLKMRELEDYFDSFGKVMNVKILPQARGNVAISAFVDFADAADAKRAHESVMEIAGQRLRTDYNSRRRESGSSDAYDDRRSSRSSRYDESSRSGYDRRERSRSPVRSRERSRSPVRSRERSRSPVRSRERSRSPMRSRERSRSPVRSRERSPVRSRERSPLRSGSSRGDRDGRRESPPRQESESRRPGRSPPRYRDDEAPARSNGYDDEQSRRSP